MRSATRVQTPRKRRLYERAEEAAQKNIRQLEIRCSFETESEYWTSDAISRGAEEKTKRNAQLDGSGDKEI